MSIKNGSRYVTMDELQAAIGKVQEDITEVRKEVGDIRTEVNNLQTKVNDLDKNLSKEIATIHTEIAGVRADLERALREQTVRIITIVGVMLGIVVAAISVVATVIGLFG